MPGSTSLDPKLTSVIRGGAILDEIEEFLAGVRPVPAPDRALATVLFTDIVSSTERVAALGDDAWTRILDRHDALIAREVEQLGPEIGTVTCSDRPI
jgi:class 3 adenylate cyclase